MAFTPKEWKNGKSGATPISAAALIDVETRVTAYGDTITASEKTRAETAEGLKLAKASNLSDLASAATARTNLSVPSRAELEIVNLGTDWSTGDLVSGGQAKLNVAGLDLNIKHGTEASPITLIQPTAKVSRTGKGTRAAINAATGITGADGAAGLAAGSFTNRELAGSEVQAVGLFAGATNESNAEGEENDPDACGLYGFGRITGGTSAKASAYGAALYGRRDVATAVANGLEVGPQNYTATAAAYEVAGSFPGGKARGIWLIPVGESDSSVGMVIDNPFGVQFDVGIAAGASAGGGKTGAIKSAFIRDDSHGKISFLVKGEHETAAIAVAKGANGVVIGAESSGNFSASGTLLDVVSENSSLSTAAIVRNTGASNTALQVSNPKGDLRLVTVGAAGGFFQGSAEGDSGVLFNSGKILHIGPSGGIRAPIRVAKQNISLGFKSADSYGSGVGVIFVANAETAPSGSPTGGGLLYVESGALKFKGSSGTVTTVAVA